MPATTPRSRRWVLGLSVAALLALSACGAENVAESFVENQLESELGGDVDVDIDDEGNATVSVSNTETGESVEFSGGSDYPDDWPAAFTQPSNVELVYVTSFGDTTTQSIQAQIQGNVDIDDVVAHYDAIAMAEGFTATESMDATLGDSPERIRNYTKAGTQLNIYSNSADGLTVMNITFITGSDDAEVADGSFDGVGNSAETLGLDPDSAAMLDSAVSTLSPETRFGIVLDQLDTPGRIEADGSVISFVFDVPEAEGAFLACMLAGVLAEENETVRLVYTDNTVDC